MGDFTHQAMYELLKQRRLLHYVGLTAGPGLPPPVRSAVVWCTVDLELGIIIYRGSNEIWCLWVQGEERDYPGLPELLDALEDLRDSMGLTPVD